MDEGGAHGSVAQPSSFGSPPCVWLTVIISSFGSADLFSICWLALPVPGAGGQIGGHERELTGAQRCILSSIGVYGSCMNSWNHSEYCIPLPTLDFNQNECIKQ